MPMQQRIIKYKPASKPEGLNCALCDFTSVSKVRIIKHMKTLHTHPNSDTLDIIDNEKTDTQHRLVVEDMSVCDISDSEESDERRVDKLLIEEKSCKMCDFEAT